MRGGFINFRFFFGGADAGCLRGTTSGHGTTWTTLA
jgi:hypothetical protein